MEWTPKKQKDFANQLSDALDKITLSNSKELTEWRVYATRALESASVARLNIPQGDYERLFENNKHGINMNVVAVLANNLEQTTPRDLDMTVGEFRRVIELNNIIGKHWDAMAEPTREKIRKQMELMDAVPKSKVILAKA